MTHPRRLLVAALAVLFVLPAAAAAQPNNLKDRILAVVDEDPVLASDLDRVVKLGLARPAAGEADERFRRRVLDQLIDERLRFHEIERFGFEQVPVEEIEAQVGEIRGGFPSEAAFQQALREVGLTLQGLRLLVSRQLLVLAYVDERLGARVFVSLEDISRYYRTTFTQEMQKQGQPVPPLEDVRDQIREVLKQQKLNQELVAWTEELRREADVVIHADQPAGKPLPPVVKRIETKKKPTP
jgi:parvulin-like peptidyl-prolyl isomerase